MEKPEKLQELIDKQLLGKLKPHEAAELAAAKQQDPALEADLVASGQALQAIEVYNDQQLKQRLRKLEQALQQEGTRRSGSTLNQAPPAPRLAASRSRKWLALAASLLFLIAATWWWMQAPAGERLGPAAFAANFTPHRNLAVNITRGSSEQVSPEEQAYAAYEAANWNEAAFAIAALPPSPLHDFYLAQIALQQQEASKATELLQKLVQTDFPLQQEAEWYLALAYMRQDQSKEATQWLEGIAAMPDHPYQKEASRLLEP